MGISGTSILTRLNPRSVSRPVSSRPAACLCRVRSPASSERSSLSSEVTRSPRLFITTSSSFVMKSRSCLAALVMADRFTRIATARLILRPFAAADVDDLHRLWVDPGVRKFLWDDQVILRETAVAVVESSIESFARKTMVSGVEALYYVMSRDDYKIHLELDSKMDVK